MKRELHGKDKKKIIRTILEAILLLILAVVVVKALFTIKSYKPYEESKVEIGSNQEDGFIAISYIATDREGTSSMISVKRLEEHLKALYNNGYVTITQKDILDYYLKDKDLPKKSLFLMFEDGRRDTAIFAQKIMEKYNFKGTMLSYTEKFDDKDFKFLDPNDLLDLEDSGFWELGTNGHRLSYINVFDRYQNYLGELSSLEYIQVRKYLGRDYNQYLMDYIRDADGIPKETYNEMRERISGDYQLVEEIYSKELKKVPELYVLMHANTGSFGNNEKVSKVNEEWITKLFSMNFNREGYSFNIKESNMYDLTRMQPQPYWYPNHLLMRIKDDTDADIQFVYGDETKKQNWDMVSGAAEYKGSDIILTSESQGNGLLRLKNSENFKNLNLNVTLTGNKLGTQSVYLRANDTLSRYTAIKVQNNVLIVEENNQILYKLNLDEFDNKQFQSIEEDQQSALEEAYKIYEKGIGTFKTNTSMEIQEDPSENETNSVSEGAEPYIPNIQINEAGDRKLDILIHEDILTVKIDDRVAASNILLNNTQSGSVYLQAAWGEYGYSQRNIADDVYDGVFHDLVIWNTEPKSAVLFDNRLSGMEKTKYEVKSKWNQLINWFIKAL